jgi:hypothetical protein
VCDRELRAADWCRVDRTKKTGFHQPLLLTRSRSAGVSKSGLAPGMSSRITASGCARSIDPSPESALIAWTKGQSDRSRRNREPSREQPCRHRFRESRGHVCHDRPTVEMRKEPVSSETTTGSGSKDQPPRPGRLGHRAVRSGAETGTLAGSVMELGYRETCRRTRRWIRSWGGWLLTERGLVGSIVTAMNTTRNSNRNRNRNRFLTGTGRM